MVEEILVRCGRRPLGSSGVTVLKILSYETREGHESYIMSAGLLQRLSIDLLQVPELNVEVFLVLLNVAIKVLTF